MAGGRAVYVENGPNNDGVYLKVTDGEVHTRQADSDKARNDQAVALLQQILAELKSINSKTKP